MLTETLSEGLAAYHIGPKIRALRLDKGLGLEQMGDHTGLSAGMLSKIERGNVFPTLPTLLRIALVFGVGLDHFFVGDRDKPICEIVRAKDRLRLPDTPTGPASFYFESLDFPVTDRRMEAYLADFPANAAPTAPHAHAGAEQVFVISGGLCVDIHGASHVLAAGDSMYFDSAYEHSYCAAGDAGCNVLVTVHGDGGRSDL
ncbi:MAG: transcriptional regulator with XRE-family HTH domain [Paracoccaceae bacterium]